MSIEPSAPRGAAGGAAGGDFVEDGAEAGVVALAGEVEQAGAGADAFEVDLFADAAGDGGLGARVDALDRCRRCRRR